MYRALKNHPNIEPGHFLMSPEKTKNAYVRTVETRIVANAISQFDTTPPEENLQFLCGAVNESLETQRTL